VRLDVVEDVVRDQDYALRYVRWKQRAIWEVGRSWTAPGPDEIDPGGARSIALRTPAGPSDRARGRPAPGRDGGRRSGRWGRRREPL